MMQNPKYKQSAVEAESGSGSTSAEATASMLKSVKQFAQRHFAVARGSHAWDHTLRVHRLCVHIGTVEGVDMAVLKTAAYLHDIGRGRQDSSNGDLCHAHEGARMAEPFVAQMPLRADQRSNILHCIETHRYRGQNLPQTNEARVLFDADKLDAIGAIGVARAFLFAGEVGARLHAPELAPAETRPYTENDTGYREYILKLRSIKSRILTAEGRRLADRRHRFMEAFFVRFLDEYNGKR